MRIFCKNKRILIRALVIIKLHLRSGHLELTQFKNHYAQACVEDPCNYKEVSGPLAHLFELELIHFGEISYYSQLFLLVPFKKIENIMSRFELYYKDFFLCLNLKNSKLLR